MKRDKRGNREKKKPAAQMCRRLMSIYNNTPHYAHKNTPHYAHKNTPHYAHKDTPRYVNQSLTGRIPLRESRIHGGGTLRQR